MALQTQNNMSGIMILARQSACLVVHHIPLPTQRGEREKGRRMTQNGIRAIYGWAGAEHLLVLPAKSNCIGWSSKTMVFFIGMGV